MLLSYTALTGIVEQGVVTNVKDGAVNPTSIDLHLGDTFMVESYHPGMTVDLAKRQTPRMRTVTLHGPDAYIDLMPEEFILCHTVEKFFMPDDLSAEFSLKSSIARCGLEHMLAGWIDAGFNNSVLTLEVKNITRYHRLRLTPGMPIGQVKFFRHEPVPEGQSYRDRGRYNGDGSVSGAKR